MAIVSWNVRGLNKEEAIRQVRLLIKEYKPDVLFLMETKLIENKLNTMCKKIGFVQGVEVPRIGLGGGQMLLWKDTLVVDHLTSSSNHISCLFRWDIQPRVWHFCGFYGDPKTTDRQYTWELLQKLRTIFVGPWLVMGDFNEILSLEDKEGGVLRSETLIEAFRFSLEVCELQPLDYRGDHFTWFRNTPNGCIKERLDWGLANEAWLELFTNNSLTHLDCYHSDHTLLLRLIELVGISANNTKKRSRFRFENMWIRELECNEIVTNSWLNTNQSALLSTIKNIQQCAQNLASWNQAKFGSLARDIKQTQQKVVHLHNIQDQLDNKEEIKAMERKLNELLLKEEVFWKQRSRVTWLKEGDQNTKKFHQRAKKRSKTNTIKGLLNAENEWVSNEEDISATIQQFYANLFTSSSPTTDKLISC